MSSNRVPLYVGIAVVAIVGIWLIGYTLFNVGGTTPGDGLGEVTTVEGRSP